jgi:hypothetical protein
MQNFENLISIAQNIPGKLKDNALTLIEQMSSVIEGIGDEPVSWKPSFLRLVQGTTDRGSIPKGTGIGEFVLGEEKVEQPLHFIPIRLWDARQYWDPDQTNNRMLCWSPDAKLGSMFGECGICPHAKWVDGEGQDCGKLKTAMVISSDLSKVFTIQFGKSNYKVGSELEGLLKKASVPPYHRMYGLVSATSSTAKNVENFKIEVLDDKLRKTPDAILPFLKELFTMINSDRKASVDLFYENTRRRQEQLALSGNAPAQIGNSSSTESSTSAEIPAVVNKAAVSTEAKKYDV